MKQRQNMWDRIAREAQLWEEPFPMQPLVELAGDRRVLIEQHCGVKEYSRERISVGVRFGLVQVCGSCLELSRMTREHLVICGKIECIQIKRRDKK